MRKLLTIMLHERALMYVRIIEKCDGKIDHYKSMDALNSMIDTMPFYVKAFAAVTAFAAEHVFYSKRKTKRQRPRRPSDIRKEIERMQAIKARVVAAYLRNHERLSVQAENAHKELHKFASVVDIKTEKL